MVGVNVVPARVLSACSVAEGERRTCEPAAVVECQPCAHLLCGCPADHADAGNSTERTECFPTEAECLDGLHICEGADLRGVVLGCRCAEVCWLDATAVVCNFDQLCAILF